MDTATAQRLNELNARFYREHAPSFSATRQAPWEGWRRCLTRALDAPAPGKQALHVLDLACGNLRFERFLVEARPDLTVRVDAVDSCATLAASAATPGVRFHELDVVSAILGGTDAPDQTRAEADGHAPAGNPAAASAGGPLAPLQLAPCDLAVSFGFLHHVPGFEQRAAVLAALVAQLRPGGVAAVSLWQFLDDERLTRKAATSHPAALIDLGLDESALDEGDRLLGWQDALGAWRYCHHFAESEVDTLSAAACAATGARELARFSADGASGRLNRYLLLQASA